MERLETLENMVHTVVVCFVGFFFFCFFKKSDSFIGRLSFVSANIGQHQKW